jgi:hypothetical protein
MTKPIDIDDWLRKLKKPARGNTWRKGTAARKRTLKK